ncbi:MAG: aminotransferase class I/II-fold pyridoxal phosphate-dependent enzyme [Candidatus Gracilibacteria bacterium]
MNHRPYENLEAPAGGDMILPLTKEFQAVREKNPLAVNGVIGEYRCPSGDPFVFPEVDEAWMETDFGKPGYIPVTGEEVFIDGTVDLAFGKDAAKIRQNGIATLGTVGGTGALAMWAKFHKKTSGAPILISKPTWPNHPQIFDDQGITRLTYDHLSNGRYDLEAHAKAIEESPDGTVVLFHAGKTHNPTGENPQTREEWEFLISKMAGKEALVDMAYLGFGGEIDEDREPIPSLIKAGIPLSVCISFAKNMGLYKERAGALLMPTATQDEAGIVQEYLRMCARTTWSSPPAQGERVAGEVLSTTYLRESWVQTLRGVAWTIARHRKALAEALGGDFSFLTRQKGLFSLLPLSEEAVRRLKHEDAIFLLPLPLENNLARLSVMGVPIDQIERFAEAVRRVMA